MSHSWNFSVRGLDPTAERFGDAPGLRNAAALLKRSLGIEDFADCADRSLEHLRVEPVDEFPCACAIVGVYLQPCIDEGTDQPSPNCTLMVCRITRPKVAIVAGLVVRMARR